MKGKYTKNDVLKYLYGEMDPAEHHDFLEALCTDEDLFETFEAVKEAHDDLGTVDLQPSDASVDRVMHYARSSARTSRPPQNPFLITGKNRLLNYHHMVSVVMVFFTCITAAVAMYLYDKSSVQENSYGMTEAYDKFENVSLDERLDLIENRLQNMLDNTNETVIPVHHDTYRIVDTDLRSPNSNKGVVFLNIK